MEKAIVGSNTGDLVKQLGDHLGIGKSKLYELKKDADVKFHKGDGEVWITPEQLSALEDLAEGRAQIVIAESVEMEAHAEEIHAETVSTEEDSINDLIRSAQELAAGMTIARYQLASQIGEDDLPEDLQQQVNEARSRVIPKLKSPQVIAKQLMQHAKRRMLAA